MNHTIGERIKAYLHAKEMNVTSLAKEAGISQSPLNKVVNGNGKPSFKTLYSLGEIGISLNWLFFGEGPMLRREEEGDEDHSGFEKYGTQWKREMIWLQEKITLLEGQLEDKENIINLLKEKTK